MIHSSSKGNSKCGLRIALHGFPDHVENCRCARELWKLVFMKSNVQSSFTEAKITEHNGAARTSSKRKLYGHVLLDVTMLIYQEQIVAQS